MGHDTDALRRAEQRLQLVLEATQNGTYEWDIGTDRIRWSENLGEMWGRGRGWTPSTFSEYLDTIHPDDRERLSEQIRATVEEGAPYEAELRKLLPDGSTRWMLTRGYVVRDEDGRPKTLVGIVSDIHESRLERRAAEYLSAASAALADTLDPGETLDRIANLALAELADWCVIHLVADDGTLEQVAVAHRDPEMVRWARELERRFPPDPQGEFGTHHVVRTGRAQLLAEITDEMLAAAARDPEHLRIARALELRSAMIVPVAAHGQTLGAITFCYAGPQRHYTPQTLALAEELGRRAGVALTNARLHRAQQESAQRLRHLQAITDVALGQLPLEERLVELLRRVRGILQTDYAVCLLLDPDEGVLRERAAVGLGAPRTHLRIPLGQGIAGKIAQQDDVVVIPDVPAAHPASRQLRGKAASLLGVPLRTQRGTVGVLHVSTALPRTFTEADAETLRLVAGRAALIIEQAAAHEQARQTAITLQRSLLPPAIPQLEGFDLAARYLPGQRGTEIGGDWYDLVALPDGREALCVGDVVGRGIAAAAIMGRLRTALRAYVRVGGGAMEAMTLLDDLVASDGEDVYATALLVVIDPATGELELCSAGHPPAVRLGAGRAELVDIPVGRPIGAPPAARESARTRLDRGQGLLLYTDGLVERRDASLDERFDRLCEAAGRGPADPERLLDHILRDMLGDGQDDDVALIGVWRRAD